MQMFLLILNAPVNIYLLSGFRISAMGSKKQYQMFYYYYFLAHLSRRLTR